MKNTIFFTIIFLSFHFLYSQEDCNKDIWIDSFLNGFEETLIDYNQDKEVENFNFSKILLNQTNYLGYIGKDKKRLRIFFDSIKKDKANNLKYNVFGKTLVGINERKFKGYIEIEDVCVFQEFLYGVDDWMKGKVENQGIVISKCHFSEDSKETATGFFEGALLFKWYIDKKHTLKYDDIEIDSDSYCNNQFLGTWTSYKTNKSSPCAWGQYKIPCSGDLNVGAAEFIPNSKYEWSKDVSNNWENKQKLQINNWKATYSFDFGGVQMGEEFEGSVTFKINNKSSKVNFPNNEEILDVTKATKDTLQLKNTSGDIYKIYKDEQGYFNVSGHKIYMLNPPNESYLLTKE